METRVSNLPPDPAKHLEETLRKLRLRELPYYPLILVFATGSITDRHCVAMKREPMPPTGAPFSKDFSRVLHSAYDINPSIHDGAVLFSRSHERDEYSLEAWSMRIVSTAAPVAAESNHGSAFNSAHSLSAVHNVDLCSILSKESASFFRNGVAIEE
ncbi:hypothetical protein ACFCW2_03795 [Qipengyuania sp. DSG2-2]|uniref:hypothetical protein n=1 Tax=Qipengyuania sp. DGS2-2 TaxID=3349631 RepID=UPI0036D24685